MNPKPWSYTSLSDFINCPKQFFEKRVAQSVKEEESEQMRYGTYVHTAFEHRIRDQKPLPPDLKEHEAFLLRLERKSGRAFTEKKVAFNKQVQPCSFFASDVWWRGVLDHHVVHDHVATITDYKTGKVVRDFKQLKMFALWIFTQYPAITVINVQFYWTQTQTTTGDQYSREQIPKLWEEFIPHLKQYREAFRTDVWQPRPSGLCNGWCPVTSCQFWKPKKEKR